MNRLNSDERAGILFTVTIHLAVLIVVLASNLGFAISENLSYFEIDFSEEEPKIEKVEEKKPVEKQEEFKESVARNVEKMLAEAGVSVRNVAVNRGDKPLKSIGHEDIDPEELYKYAKDVDKAVHTKPEVEDKDFGASEPEREKPKKKEEKKAAASYSGPSVVSYDLGGRRASHLAIPAYKCMGSGTVTVIIGVDSSGRVIEAKVQDDVSDSNSCLRNYAISAAKRSRFAIDRNAPARQMGNIVYQFIAQ